MIRKWRATPRQLLGAFVALDILLLIYTRTAGASLNAGQPVSGQLAWTALDGWLVWRIWRHGRVAWAVLLVLSVLPLLQMAVGAVWPWNLYVLGLLALAVAQVALLLSPAVRHHLRGRQTQRIT